MPDYLMRNLHRVEAELAYINPTFEKMVTSHILGNYMTNSCFPLYLAIHGPRGEGKTFQTLYSCQKMGINVYYVSGAELSGSFEADSVNSIEKSRDDAIQRYRKEGQLSVFIIDDFHLSVASVDIGVSKTVNSQLLTGWMMNQADRAMVGLRIPFILLGNDYVNLYAPLTRDGRMDFYEWKPTPDEKMTIICRHFEDYIDTEYKADFVKFIETYIDQPISFFSELKKDMKKKQVREVLWNSPRKDLHQTISILNRICSESILKSGDVIAQLNELASERIKQASAKNTLHEDRR